MGIQLFNPFRMFNMDLAQMSPSNNGHVQKSWLGFLSWQWHQCYLQLVSAWSSLLWQLPLSMYCSHHLNATIYSAAQNTSHRQQKQTSRMMFQSHFVGLRLTFQLYLLQSNVLQNWVNIYGVQWAYSSTCQRRHNLLWHSRLDKIQVPQIILR